MPPSRRPSVLNRRLLILPPLLLGAAVLAVVVSRRSTPQPESIPESSRALLVIDVPKCPVVPRVVGFGSARPREIWSAVAEVKGRIVEAHPELKAGAIIEQGETVLRIDPTEYELMIAQLQAEVAQIEAQQAELDAQEVNFRDALAIEAESLRLAQNELQRLGRLRSSNSVTESELEETSRMVLAQQQSVQSMRSSLKVLPAQRNALVANVEAKQAALAQSRLNLDRTVIQAPFDCRLSEVALEQGQFVNAGQNLFEAFGSAVTEVEAQLPIDQLRRLINTNGAKVDFESDAMQAMRSVFDVEVLVRLRSGDFVVEWQGRFDRVREELDLQTRTVRVVVAVDRPYDNVVPGERPPLSPGMFCEVELRGQRRPDQIVVPRTSVWGGSVYLVNSDDRLEIRPVDVRMLQGGFTVIADGLAGGERLVVSDPTPAIEGMLVEPTSAVEIRAALVSEAAGKGELR